MRKTFALLLGGAMLALGAAPAEAAHHPKPVKPTHGKVAGSTYTCNAQSAGAGPLNLTIRTDGKPALFLDAGCPSGSTFTILTTNDCVHAHAGAKGTFHITCSWTGHSPAAEHQDGVQVMGGGPYSFPNLHVGFAPGVCPAPFACGISAQNGGIFCNGPNGQPHDVTVDHANIFSLNTAVVKGPDCTHLTVTNSTLRGLHNGCYRHKGDAIVSKGNTCLP